MIDPQNIVKYDRTDEELEELMLFCICVAGKQAKSIAPRVAKLQAFLQDYFLSQLVFHKLTFVHMQMLEYKLRELGIGCYRQKSRAIMEVANYVNLKTCGPRDLEDIYGIGPKTARAFICWSRSDVSHAILDTHILKWLKQQGVDRVPKSTPTGISYIRLEKEFLSRVPASMTPAEFDLSIWTSFAR